MNPGECRRGLVALGDSITFGEGQAMLGVRCQSWALWLADALELPYTNLAANAAQVRDLDEQLARMRGPYELCCLYIGVNDARAVDFDVNVFAAALGDAAERAAADADHVLMATLPLDLGRPRAGVSVLEANRAIREVAGAHRATVVGLESLRGWRLVLPDAVHLTAVGQVEVAQRAGAALRAGGRVVAGALQRADERASGASAASDKPLSLRAAPLQLAAPACGVRSLARYAVTAHAAAVARDLRRRVREGAFV